jgi:hypothetical protein
VGRFVIHFFLLIVLSALFAAALVAFRLPDLTDVNVIAVPNEKVLGDDWASQMEQSTIKQANTLEYSEAQLNAYLAVKLRGRVKTSNTHLDKFDRLLVDLEPGLCTVHFCHNLWGHTFVATVVISIERQAKTFRVEILRGAYGRLAVPRGLLLPLIPALNDLAQGFEPEIKALFKMPKIHLNKNKLSLDPRF